MKRRFKRLYRFLFKKHRRKTFVVLGLFFLWYIFCLPRPLFDAPSSLVLQDRDGQLLGARIAEDGQWRFPAADSLPISFVTALLEFEDRRFFRHLGIDPRGLARALVQNIKHRRIVSGGSTISMQVIRMARGNKPRNLWQKLLEMIHGYPPGARLQQA